MNAPNQTKSVYAYGNCISAIIHTVIHADMHLPLFCYSSTFVYTNMYNINLFVFTICWSSSVCRCMFCLSTTTKTVAISLFVASTQLCGHFLCCNLVHSMRKVLSNHKRPLYAQSIVTNNPFSLYSPIFSKHMTSMMLCCK